MRKIDLTNKKLVADVAAALAKIARSDQAQKFKSDARTCISSAAMGWGVERTAQRLLDWRRIDIGEPPVNLSNAGPIEAKAARDTVEAAFNAMGISTTIQGVK